MKQRDVFLKEFRGESIGTVSSLSSFDEYFQNEILRPILKLQNDIFIITFINYTNKNKIDFNSFSVEKKLVVIENSIQKDIKFRNALKGMIVGLFTIEEYKEYIQNSSSLNKRMMGMLIERLKSQVQLLDSFTI
ncbi:glyoxalase [Flavobacterium cellulosilyticum]|uniref:Glyoxalase n=1 Tax=Flavobacterium cellulosilyticum TaxID=2541731 RepID=A0A4R5C816_9FLAO|nr:glyoxalase [Flavobacterium cellulosilyticum]TDD94899.1 glyoxalase [Flavobacterium cellulosilyticum]